MLFLKHSVATFQQPEGRDVGKKKHKNKTARRERTAAKLTHRHADWSSYCYYFFLLLLRCLFTRVCVILLLACTDAQPKCASCCAIFYVHCWLWWRFKHTAILPEGTRPPLRMGSWSQPYRTRSSSSDSLEQLRRWVVWLLVVALFTSW